MGFQAKAMHAKDDRKIRGGNDDDDPSRIKTYYFLYLIPTPGTKLTNERTKEAAARLLRMSGIYDLVF